MIEITAKQLYDAYRHLPNPKRWLVERGSPRIRLSVLNNLSYEQVTKEMSNGKIPLAQIIELEFSVDTHSEDFEWKPTTDLIIKA